MLINVVFVRYLLRLLSHERIVVSLKAIVPDSSHLIELISKSQYLREPFDVVSLVFR